MTYVFQSLGKITKNLKKKKKGERKWGERMAVLTSWGNQEMDTSVTFLPLTVGRLMLLSQ